MSIKSQKSLNDECTEIFERSYSVKSASDDSASSDDENVSKELLKKLTPAMLSKLRKCFKKAKHKHRDLDKKVDEVMSSAAAQEGIKFPPTASSEGNDLVLSGTAFVEALQNVLGKSHSTAAHRVYQSMDRFSTVAVSWAQLVGRLVDAGARATAPRCDTWTPVRVHGVRKMEHCKREVIVRVLSLCGEQSCVASVSRGGRVCLYDLQLTLLHTYQIFYHKSGVKTRVKNCWVTDAVYMSDVRSVAVSLSDRSLMVYDASTLNHAPLLCVRGLPHIPTCLAYCPQSSELLFGTERGQLVRVRFLQPKLSLLHVHQPDTVNYYYWMELSSPPHTSYCAISSRSAHGRAVRRVAYVREDLSLSCSHDALVSVRMMYLSGKLDDYLVSVHRGISCFHYSPGRRVLATGSKDGVVRLYTLGQVQPHALLIPPPGTPAAVVDVLILDIDVVVGYYSNCMIHIWDLYEECLLQSIKLKYPFLGVLGVKVEFGTTCLHLGPSKTKVCAEDKSRSSSPLEEELDLKQSEDLKKEESVYAEVLVTCNDYICTLRYRTRAPLEPSTTAPRQTDTWDMYNINVNKPASSNTSPRSKISSASTEVETDIHTQSYDLDQLIANAGLEKILEKDFVMMRGLKHDLNKKLFEMKANSENCSHFGPYQSLSRHSPEPLPSFNGLAHTYERVKQLFPGPSVPVTPSTSNATTPRKHRKNSGT